MEKYKLADWISTVYYILAAKLMWHMLLKL